MAPEQWLRTTNKKSENAFCDYRFEASHGEEVSHHSGESRREARLSDESKFEFGQTDHVITSFPIPAGNV